MRHALALTLGKLRAVWPTTLRSRFGWAFFASLVVVLSVVLVHTASADALEYVANGMINAIARIMLAIANLAIGLCLFFLKFFIAIASYNNYIDVDVVQLGWVMVRDVANMFFVVVLLVIAFGTILGLEEYEWKKNLVKLILAAIFINFSNLIAQLFIDVAHVFTMTFLNAISATAGGNLISMFKLNEITAMVGVDPAVDTEFNTEILAGTAIAAIFAVMAAMVMGSYVFVMMGRVVSLWALIILSPLAYILGVLPKTKSYAERWWSEFSSNVIVAPIMVFFLWLSFATLGAGDIMTDIQQGIPAGNQIQPNQSVELVGSNFVEKGESSKLSLSKVSTWENMANFLIALAFLRVGVKTTEETGVWGSDMISSAWSFGKDVAKYATGYAAGRWLVGKGQDTLKTGASAALWRAPIVGGRALTNYGKMAQIGFGKMGIGRDNWAKSLEEPAKKLRDAKADLASGKIDQAQYNKKVSDIGAGGAFGVRHLRGVLASIVQTNGRAEKKAEDWTKAVDAQKTYKEENYSTSDSGGGRSKLKWGIMAHAAETMASAKKDQKYAEGEQRILAAEGRKIEEVAAKLKRKDPTLTDEQARDKALKQQKTSLSLLEDTTFSAKARAEAAKDTMAIHSNQLQEKARESAGVYGVKNLSEAAGMDLAEQVADARAAAYEQSGDPLRANAVRQAARAERLKKDGELFTPMGYDEQMIQEQALNRSIGIAQTAGDNDLVKKLRRQKVALAILNSKIDPDNSRDGRAKAMAGLGITQMNDADRLKNELSRLVGTNVASEAEGMRLFSEMYDNDDAKIQAALAALSRSYKDGGAKGDVDGLGLIGATMDPTTGISRYSFNAGGAHAQTGKTAAFVRYMTLNQINDVTGLSGKYKIAADGGRTNTGVSARGQVVLKELLTGKDSRSVAQIKPSFLKSLDDTDLTTPGAVTELRALFTELETSMPESGYKALVALLPKLQAGGAIP